MAPKKVGWSVILLWFYILLTISAQLGQSKKYVFLKNFASSISLATKGVLYWEKTPFEKFDHEERQALCSTALNNASLPSIAYDHYISKAQLYRVRYRGEYDSTTIIAIDCRSYPSTYLGYLASNQNSIQMIFFEDLNHMFLEETVTSMEESKDSSRDDTVSRELRSHYFNTGLDGEDRWNLCFSARNRIQQEIKFVEGPINTTRDVISPQVYLKDSVNPIVAIKCQTIPTMYLALKSVKSVNDESKIVKIIFTESDLKNQGWYD